MGYSVCIRFWFYRAGPKRLRLKMSSNLVIKTRPAFGQSAPGSGFNVVFFIPAQLSWAESYLGFIEPGQKDLN